MEEISGNDNKKIYQPHKEGRVIDEVSQEKKIQFLTKEDVERLFPFPEQVENEPLMRQMYSPAEKILIGQVDNSTEEDMHFALAYLERLVKEDDAKVDNFESRFGTCVHDEYTEKIKQRTTLHTEESLLKEQREKLFVTEENEKLFDIKVVGPENWDEMTSVEKETWWQENTGSQSLFVIRGKENGKKIIPTIVLSITDAEALLGKVEDSMGTKNMFEHEYRHTQRKYSSDNDNLFRFIDEATTNVKAYYASLQGVLSVFNMTTEAGSFLKMKDAYEEGNDAEQAALLEHFEKEFGAKAVLLLGAKKSSEHSEDNDGLKDLPLIQHEKFEEKHENVRFMETMLSLRAAVDKNWIGIFKKNIAGERVSRALLEIYRSYALASFFKDSEKGMTPHVRMMTDAIDAEIKRREMKGEQGW